MENCNNIICCELTIYCISFLLRAEAKVFEVVFVFFDLLKRLGRHDAFVRVLVCNLRVKVVNTRGVNDWNELSLDLLR